MDITRRDFAKFGAAAAAAASIGGLAGCAGGSGSGGSGAGAKAVIEEAIAAEPPMLDSILTVSSVAHDIMSNVVEPLFTLNADYEPVCMLAESYELSDDGTVYAIKLREGVKFHNGDEMTAADVVASMNRWLQNNSRAKTLLAGAAFEEAGDYAVTLTLPAPASDTLILLATHSQYPGILPKSVVEAADAEKGISDYIGTGPYTFSEWKSGSFIELTRFADYASRDEEPSGFSGAKKAPTETLRFQVSTDTSTRVSGLQTGEYDVADEIPTERYAELAADDETTLFTRNAGILAAFLNTKQGPLANEALRHAVMSALDFDAVMKAAFGDSDLYTLDHGFMNPAQEQWKSDAGAQYYNHQDQGEVERYLAEAGYAGETITLMTTPDYQEMYAATVAVQQQLSDAGISAEIASYEFATMMDYRANDPGKWDFFIASTGYQLTPPLILAVTPSFYGNDDAEVASGVAAVHAAATEQEASEAWAKVQQRLYDTAAAWPFGHYMVVVGTTPSIEGFEYFLAPVLWNASVPQ